MGDIPNFLPSKQGLQYDNNWPSYPDKTISTPFGPVRIGNATTGLCGGMTFAVRDLYEMHRDPPPERPAGGSPGFNYIVDRLFDSFNIPSGIIQYYEWMNLSAHNTLLGPPGTSWLTIRENLPIVRYTIDSGHPCPLGLVLAHSSDPARLGDNHQVLAWGYEDQGPRTIVKIYDPNFPDNDTATIEFDHTNPAHTTDFQCPTTGHIYGFFAVSYSPRNPDPLFESEDLAMRVERRRDSVSAAGVALVTTRSVNQPLRDLISSIPPLGVDSPADTSGSTSSINEGGLTVSKQQHHVVANANTLAALNPNASVLWPASLVQGKTLASGSLAPIPADRSDSPVVLVLTNLMPAGGGSTQRTVPAPTQGNVQDSINSLLEQSLQPATPANFAYTIKEFYSLDHAMLSVGMSAQWMSGSAHASLSLESDDVTHNYLVQVTQQYYSIAVQPPNHPDDFFATTVTPADLHDYIGPGNPPLYVSSVTYGRQLFIFARSHTHSGKLRAALDGSFSSGTTGGKFDATGESAQLINESDITVFALGGASAGVPIPLVGDKASNISAYVDAGKNFNPATSPGSPLSYVCTYLRDSTTASISFSTDYTVNTVSQIVQSDDWNPSSGIFGERQNHDFAISMPDGFMWDGDIQFLRDNLIEYNQRGGATHNHSLWVDGVPAMQNDGNLHVNVHTGWPGSGSTSIRVQARCVSSPNA